MAENLNPCPFCGMAANVGSYDAYGGKTAWSVECANWQECGAINQSHDTRESAMAAWNRRSQQVDTSLEV